MTCPQFKVRVGDYDVTSKRDGGKNSDLRQSRKCHYNPLDLADWKTEKIRTDKISKACDECSRGRHEKIHTAQPSRRTVKVFLNLCLTRRMIKIPFIRIEAKLMNKYRAPYKWLNNRSISASVICAFLVQPQTLTFFWSIDN